MKLALVTSPVAALYSPTVLAFNVLPLFNTKRMPSDNASAMGAFNPVMNFLGKRSSRAGVVFANRAVAQVRHEEEGVSESWRGVHHGESGRTAQSRDEAGVNRGSRFGVVFADRAAGRVRHEEEGLKHE